MAEVAKTLPHIVELHLASGPPSSAIYPSDLTIIRPMSLALCLLCGSSCSDVSPLSATVHSLHRLIGYPTLTTAAQHKWHYLGIKLYVWPIITSDTSPLQTVQCSPVLLPPPPCSTLPSLTHYHTYTDHPS